MNDRFERLETMLTEILSRLDKLQPAAPHKDYWSPEDLAAALGRKPFTVREWCRLRRINAEKERYSRLWRIPDSEAQRLLAGGGLQPEVRS